jgi:hypothetical protein
LDAIFVSSGLTRIIQLQPIAFIRSQSVCFFLP